MFAGRQNRQTSANTRICERRKCVWQAAERCQSHVNIHIKNPYQVISAGHENTNIYILFLLFVFSSPMHNKFMYNKNVSSFVQPLFIQWCVKCNKRMWRDTTPKNISISYIYICWGINCRRDAQHAHILESDVIWEQQTNVCWPDVMTVVGNLYVFIR